MMSRSTMKNLSYTFKAKVLFKVLVIELKSSSKVINVNLDL